MTFNQATISSSSMVNRNAVAVFNSEIYNNQFNLVPNYFHESEAFFGETVMEQTIPTPSTILQYHVPYDDVYWHTSIVNADHGNDGILELDLVYPPNGSEWDGCAAEWDFDGTYSVENDIPVSTSVRVTDNTDVNMVSATISSSSFSEKDILSTVNMDNKHINNSTMVQRNPNA